MNAPGDVTQQAPGSDGSRTQPPGSDSAASRRQELASFLRSRRERIAPEQVGLPPGRRRRTPGLRREEVAQLAAVGVTWYTWLEQARDIQVSSQVADAIARALMLDQNERRHLFTLAGTADPHPHLDCPGVSPAVRAMIDQLEPLPAAVFNSRFDIVAHNRTYGRLVCDLDELPAEDRNVMWLAFTDPRWRERMLDREENTRVMAAKFRASMANHLAEPAWKELLRRLQQNSPEFREAWERHEVLQPGSHVKRYLNPEVGLLAFDFTHLWLGPQDGPRLTVYSPVDQLTRERLEQLHRVVIAQRRPVAV
ncbi:helix-turn-helix transcriptional regulator [Actinacidiphila bryophytorum]|uniref:DNA-binding protein n=1 Tax=Actinacidiphila bryophytorum TaxID=1436133 RepID=A0A9W4E4Q4_9ACTN|nr:helix-turn-helix transcriptional regulator [Actinacidiphila bryophytorum]MBM9434636.1 helix-turn-helix domain-containing protein [Actinacidiphila bryophytorum]MBN6546535.1 helix-turn-helix domain-containing protein [Actinacidiphila bryophytorum]CAG7628330.1 putative DNA-binding protein [Actinacidiphila bryophytorum]